MKYLFNSDTTGKSYYTTLAFTLTSKYLGNIRLDVSSYIDEQTIWRLTDNAARSMIRNIVINGKDFDVDYQIQAINGRWGSYRNYISLLFTQKDPKREKPVILSFKYDVSLPFKVTEDLLKDHFKEMVESWLGVVYKSSKVELVNTDFCVDE